MNLDILFINPGNQKKIYQNLADEFSGIDAPIWILLMAEKIRRFDFSAAIYDANLFGWDIDTIKELEKKYNPKLIVVLVYGNHPSASTQSMPAAIKIILDIKKYNQDILVAIGGTHPSALPRQTFKETNADFILANNGIYAALGLIKYLTGKIKITEIPDLYYRKKDDIEYTFKSADLKKDLDDELPGYAWDLLENVDLYRAHNWHCFQYFKDSKTPNFSDVRSPYISIFSSLGCQYNCSYCCINSVYGKPGIKQWSIDKVISLIDILVKKYKVKNIRFADELFVLSSQRVEKFCDLIIERDYDLNIWVYARIDTIKSELLSKMKKAGINWLALGIESADARVRNAVGKKINADIKTVVKMIKANDINIIGNFMFGLPEDNLESMQNTFNLAVELNCEFINFYTVMAYPGSKLYDEFANKKELLPDTWLGYSQHSYETKPLPSRYLSAKEILKFRDTVFYKYFQNENYRKLILNKFGATTLAHLDRMTEIKLKRKLLENEM
ncbi:MAG TPA: radical SAM protein [bacterium]|nr:radical SAM protein [bacterium]